MNELIRLRRKLALDIAEQLKLSFIRDRRFMDDEDAIAEVIETTLPLSYAEAQAEWDEMKKAEEIEAPRKPSALKGVFDQLREALGLDETVSITGVMKSALERIEKRKEFSDEHLSQKL